MVPTFLGSYPSQSAVLFDTDDDQASSSSTGSLGAGRHARAHHNNEAAILVIQNSHAIITTPSVCENSGQKRAIDVSGRNPLNAALSSLATAMGMPSNSRPSSLVGVGGLSPMLAMSSFNLPSLSVFDAVR
jgi:hypothetical protein